MAIKVGFKDSIDSYYRNQDTSGGWADVLSALDRTYANANYKANTTYQNQLATAKASGQSQVSDLYSQYLASRQALGAGNYTNSFTSGAMKKIKDTIGNTASNLYGGALAQVSPVQSYDYTTDNNAIYSAYNNQLNNLSGTMSGLLSYFNTDVGVLDDFSNAKKMGLLNDNGEFTAKGLSALKYYFNADSEALSGAGGTDKDGVPLGDSIYNINGTLQSYLENNVDNFDSSQIQEISRIIGLDNSSPAYTDSQVSSLLGTTVTTANVDSITTDFDTKKLVAEALPDATALAQNVLGDKDKNLYTDITEAKGAEAYVKGQGYVMGDSTTNKVLKNATGNDWLNVDKNNLGDTITLNGMSVNDSIKYGVLQNGSIFNYGGIQFIIYNNEVRVFVPTKSSGNEENN